MWGTDDLTYDAMDRSFLPRGEPSCLGRGSRSARDVLTTGRLRPGHRLGCRRHLEDVVETGGPAASRRLRGLRCRDTIQHVTAGPQPARTRHIGGKVREQELSNQIADLARRLDALGGELVSRPDDTPALDVSGDADVAAQALILELTRSVDGLQRHVDQLRRAEQTGSLAARSANAASEAPSALTTEWPWTEFDATGLDTSRTPTPLASRGAHGVHFSRSHDHTVAAIIEMFDDARALGRPAVVVATRVHRRWIEADLHQRCIAFEGDVCRLLDAETTLSSLLLDGEPDRDRFRSVIGTLLSDVCSRNPGGVSVYGEMVGLLWSEGRVAAAMRLEELWNELQRELPFSLLCGYLIDGSPDSTDLDPIRHVHTYVG